MNNTIITTNQSSPAFGPFSQAVLKLSLIHISVFNSASEKITGYNKHKALGKKITEVIPETKLLNILETEQSEIGDIQRLDDHTVIASNRVPVIVDGEVLGAVATYQDITEVQKLEQKIRIRLSEKGLSLIHI